MLKKVIKYTDFNDNEREETFYFNLTKAELAEMRFASPEGFEAYINSIVEAKDLKTLVGIMKDLVLKSYGEKSLDGKYFEKSEEISRKFAATEAYSVLYMELATDDNAAAAFINGILPSDIRDKMEETK